MAVIPRHTCGSNLLLHPHIHCVVPAGGLSANHRRWVPTRQPLFLLPIPVLRRVFRDKFIDWLKHLFNKELLNCAARRQVFKTGSGTPNC
jgi:hypothetical protein